VALRLHLNVDFWRNQPHILCWKFAGHAHLVEFLLDYSYESCALDKLSDAEKRVARQNMARINMVRCCA